MKEKKAERIGLLGGSFNPIHHGHLLLAKAAYEQEKLDQVLLIPCGMPYKKKLSGIAPAKERLHMTRLAAEAYPWLSASDMEVSRSGNTYTCDTLRLLRREQPDSSFFFIMGADCLFSIEEWKNPQEIFKNCTLLASVRDVLDIDMLRQKQNELEKRYGAVIKLLSFPQLPISSTLIRSRIREERSIRYLVPDAVRQYIEENHIYR